MMLVHVLLSATDAEAGVPLVSYAEEDTLGLRLASAVDVARDRNPAPPQRRDERRVAAVEDARAAK